jgi:hypothetical protein
VKLIEWSVADTPTPIQAGGGSRQKQEVTKMKKVVLPTAAMLFCFISAAKAEDIVLDCHLTQESGKTYKVHVETDGVSLTLSSDVAADLSYTNAKSEGNEQHLRISRSEIAFGANYAIPPLKSDFVINRITGEMASSSTAFGETTKEVGRCEKAVTTPSKF